jgi:hypothetical protein
MGIRRLFTAALFLALTVSVANAYTIVMRDGRRVEIPNEFSVTGSTVTYEVSNGFQVTIQLNTVDIAATERANGEAQGAFLRKANAPAASSEDASQARRGSAGRSITNADLEKYRRARVEGEKEYESRRQELGLPSLEERRREVAAIEDRTLEQVRSMRAQEEAYWRSRADALRAEMAANPSQFEYSRQRYEDIPYSFGGFPAFWPFDTAGFGVAAGGFNRFRQFPSSPFSGFLSTPITPFPTFPFTSGFGGHGRRPVFVAPGVRFNSRPSNMRHGSRK